eukprot:11098705-Prorocentrum_lima.AAC.1
MVRQNAQCNKYAAWRECSWSTSKIVLPRSFHPNRLGGHGLYDMQHGFTTDFMCGRILGLRRTLG